MDINGISNVGIPVMAPVGMPAGPTAQTIDTLGLAPAAMGRMDQLIQMLQEFSSSEVLMALLMSHARASHHSTATKAESEATAAFGLATAIQLAGQPVSAAYMALPAAGAGIGGVQISVQG